MKVFPGRPIDIGVITSEDLQDQGKNCARRMIEDYPVVIYLQPWSLDFLGRMSMMLFLRRDRIFDAQDESQVHLLSQLKTLPGIKTCEICGSDDGFDWPDVLVVHLTFSGTGFNLTQVAQDLRIKLPPCLVNQ